MLLYIEHCRALSHVTNVVENIEGVLSNYDDLCRVVLSNVVESSMYVEAYRKYRASFNVTFLIPKDAARFRYVVCCRDLSHI